MLAHHCWGVLLAEARCSAGVACFLYFVIVCNCFQGLRNDALYLFCVFGPMRCWKVHIVLLCGLVGIGICRVQTTRRFSRRAERFAGWGSPTKHWISVTDARCIVEQPRFVAFCKWHNHHAKCCALAERRLCPVQWLQYCHDSPTHLDFEQQVAPAYTT